MTIPATPTEKSDRAFRTISEAAEVVGVPQHVLRFWETRFPELQPLKRGGNRRYYRPADMELLETIRAMLHDQGLTIRGAKLVLAGGAELPQGSTLTTQRSTSRRATDKSVGTFEAVSALPRFEFAPSAAHGPLAEDGQLAGRDIDRARLRVICERLRLALAA